MISRWAFVTKEGASSTLQMEHPFDVIREQVTHSSGMGPWNPNNLGKNSPSSTRAPVGHRSVIGTCAEGRDCDDDRYTCRSDVNWMFSSTTSIRDPLSERRLVRRLDARLLSCRCFLTHMGKIFAVGERVAHSPGVGHRNPDRLKNRPSSSTRVWAQ